ncbi:hypothetical protein [Streptomyces sp. NPDC005438]|uniref:hypothetical protein n=1 Tax=Streptomyces sp. NPDC005438 TaxID=3156880 RepID=UPI0033ACFF6B
MLTLRLIRGATPLALVRRTVVLAASMVVAFLLFTTLGYGLDHPERADEATARLLWCLLPTMAMVQLAACLVRLDLGPALRRGLTAAGLGPPRLPLLAAVSTWLTCSLGSLLTLLVCLFLRGEWGAAPFDGALADALAAERHLPLAGTLTLLLVPPLLAALGSAWTMRGRERARRETRGTATTAQELAEKHSGESRSRDDAARTEPTPGRQFARFPWGVALIAAGLAWGSLTKDVNPRPLGGASDIHDGLPSLVPPLSASWLLTFAGLIMVGPGVVAMCGRLLTICRPGPTRLVTGRLLYAEAHPTGYALGTLCAVGAAAFAAREFQKIHHGAFGPLTGLAAALIVSCVTVSVVATVAESRRSQASTVALVRRIGARWSLALKAQVLQVFVPLAVMAPLAWTVGRLTALTF